jgi:nucleoside-diphosphate-sugar epimerase
MVVRVYEKKVCLITGGAGFLGKKYCEFFLKKNYLVLCVDNSKKNLKTVKSINSNLFAYL